MAGAQNDDPAGALMLDGNAVAGELQAVFGSDMTATTQNAQVAAGRMRWVRF